MPTTASHTTLDEQLGIDPRTGLVTALSYAQMAAKLGLSESTVASQVSRIRRGHLSPDVLPEFVVLGDRTVFPVFHVRRWSMMKLGLADPKPVVLAALRAAASGATKRRGRPPKQRAAA